MLTCKRIQQWFHWATKKERNKRKTEKDVMRERMQKNYSPREEGLLFQVKFLWPSKSSPPRRV